MSFYAIKKSQMIQYWSMVIAISLIAVTGCGNYPPAPDWALNAEASAQKATAAYLQGRQHVEALQWQKAREAVASTAQPALAAKLELMRCAAQVASLDWNNCPGYEALAEDASREDQAYARYLKAQPQAQDIELLPKTQRAAAQLLLSSSEAGDALPEMTDSLSEMVAAGVLLRAGRGSPALLQRGVDAASQQGWRRPLLAWLSLQLKDAQQRGDSQKRDQVQRRLQLLQASASL